MNTLSILKRELVLSSAYNGRKIAVDVTYAEHQKPLIPIVFVHTFKSFKDWGAFNLIAAQAAEEGFAFIKYNSSHNGTSPEHPTEFVDLEGFRQNTFSIELDDLNTVISAVHSGELDVPNLRLDKLSLLGHGRGGNIALIKTSEDNRIHRVVSWNASDKILDFRPEIMQKWKEDGVLEFWNVRVKRHMPVSYQFVEDYYANEPRYNMQNVMERIASPVLLVHGEEDTRVRIERAYALEKMAPEKVTLKVILKADHMFGTYHPYVFDYLNSETQQACTATFKFLQD